MSELRRGLVIPVAEALREQVVAGRAGEAVPGVRTLAKTLGVSVPTICRALHQLAGEGLLEPGGIRRRWRVAETSPPALEEKSGPAEPHRKRLLCLAPEELALGKTSNVETFAALLDRVGAHGWEVMFRIEKFSGAKRPHRSWDRILRFNRPDAMVVWAGTPVLGRWALEHGIRSLFLGGTSGTARIPVLRVNLAAMVRDAAERLLATGHKRILMPMLERPADLVRECRIIAEQLHGHGNPLEIIESPYSGPDVISAVLQRQWRQEAADALIFMDWREFVAAGGFLRRTGLEIPRDLSVILLTRNAIMDWHSPPISCYEHPVNPVARAAARWVTGSYRDQALPGVSELPSLWIERDSIRSRLPQG